LECYRCGVSGCHLRTTCSAKEKFCAKQHNRISTLWWHGCVETCTEDETWKFYRKCCTTNLCNI
uniref:Toxin S6C6 n=1 Tax=Dendroaspis jamesoni kaimosae TaxID=8619 RepID=3NOJ6_DENJA|nr:RecName: Full=Toxin S6C6 [Dendroaspis jamesoni kaimosae]